jgi:Mg2+/Co2+ transporter CorC
MNSVLTSDSYMDPSCTPSIVLPFKVQIEKIELLKELYLENKEIRIISRSRRDLMHGIIATSDSRIRREDRYIMLIIRTYITLISLSDTLSHFIFQPYRSTHDRTGISINDFSISHE